MSEQPHRPTDDNRDAWRAYWQAQGMPWRTEPEVDEERQRFLAERRAVTPNIERGIYPFRDENGGIKLARADVEWLLATLESGGMRGPVDWQDRKQREREGLDLRGANLRGAVLARLPLASLRAGLGNDTWREATREQREAAVAHLEEAHLYEAHLENAALRGCHMERAHLLMAHLNDSRLRSARLSGADLRLAHLEGASLQDTYVAGKDMDMAHLNSVQTDVQNFPTRLPGANLRYAHFTIESHLEGLVLTDKYGNSPLLDGVDWGSANLTFVDWTQMEALGDEQQARRARTDEGIEKHAAQRLDEFQTAVRANRQLATVLRGQGLNEDADRFAYRAQLLQREVLRRQGKWARAFGSWLLDVVSGYGYKPMRSFITYAVFVLGFAFVYFLLRDSVSPALNPVDALIFSITSFHGRGFSPGEVVTLHDPLTILAAVEAIIGLLIEITFIATFTQRFFAR